MMEYLPSMEEVLGSMREPYGKNINLQLNNIFITEWG